MLSVAFCYSLLLFVVVPFFPLADAFQCLMLLVVPCCRLSRFVVFFVVCCCLQLLLVVRCRPLLFVFVVAVC